MRSPDTTTVEMNLDAIIGAWETSKVNRSFTPGSWTIVDFMKKSKGIGSKTNAQRILNAALEAGVIRRLDEKGPRGYARYLDVPQSHA